MKRRMQTLHKTLQAGWQILLRLLKTSVMIGGILVLCDGLLLQPLATAANVRNDLISEVSPPNAIQELRAENITPKIKIVSPKADETVSDPTVTVRLQAENFKPFKDPKLGLGPYLTINVDDLPGQFVYETNAAIELKDLKPGTHVLRVFANHPWGESYKNPEAYAQVTFNVLTTSNRPQWDPQQPLLTYNQPTGVLGAEPILLDYYLATPKFHTSDDSLLKDNIQVRITVNGQSFKTDRWLPLYLKGFRNGTNWIRLELLDRQDQPLKGSLNEVTQAFQFQPRGQDGLARLVQDQFSKDELQQIVDPVASQKAAKARQRIVPPAPVTPLPKAAPLPTLEVPNPPQSTLPKLSTPPPVPSQAPKIEVPQLEQPSSMANEPVQPKPTVSAPKAVETKPEPSAPRFWERFKQGLPEPAKPEMLSRQPVQKKVESSASVRPAPSVVSTPSPTPTPSLPAPLPEQSLQSPNLVRPSKSPIQAPQPLPRPNKVEATESQKSPIVSLEEAQQKAKDLWTQFKRSLPKVSTPEIPKPTPARTPDLPKSQSPSGPEVEMGKLSVEPVPPSSESKPPISPAPVSKLETGGVDKPTQNPLPNFLKRFQAAKQQVQQPQSFTIELTP